ncbi:MAG TPA: preprotein translocase subunit YajC [Bacteroidales bacterium]|nr:preprotein translocase subunit YajC [Bacteroidales bacterium]HPS17379.1 preprotein translocase subunit YajC [Bacteroidales bacterium]
MTRLLTILMAQPTDGKSGGSLQMLLMFGLIIVVFYFFMIRPQVKRTKEQKKFREGLKKGDKIITIGGIHGKIVETQETTFIIETEGQGRLKIEKSAVASGFNAEQIATNTK